MLVYRLAHPKYAKDISGYGALLTAGRWHYKGNRILYTAENSSLALLEYLVHTEGLSRRLPYELITISIPDAAHRIIRLEEMPSKWKENITITRDLGSEWLQKGETLLLKVPSVINEDNCNFLINPEHPDFNEVKIIGTKKITFDSRL